MNANSMGIYPLSGETQFGNVSMAEMMQKLQVPDSCAKPLKRAWNKSQIQELYNLTKNYCILSCKPAECLVYEDYACISAMINQPPLKCMKKIREICATGSLAQGAWSATEDQLLLNLVNSKIKKWGHISEYLNRSVHSGMKIRSGKQCKERWLNHLDPNMKRDKWTEFEDLKVLKLFKSLGNKWSEISKIVGNRTDSSIKNRVKSLINKQKQELLGNESAPSNIDSIIQRIEEALNK